MLPERPPFHHAEHNAQNNKKRHKYLDHQKCVGAILDAPRKP